MVSAKHWKYPKDSDLVLTALRGLVASNPTLTLIPSEKVVYHSSKDNEVIVISGGGAGHEPLHSGFVGLNLLDAAVSGSIFASPSTRQIMAAIKATATNNKDVLIVVKNYTGDVLHFGLVAEKAKRDGYNVELVTVADDVAVGRTQNEMVGRRGLAGTALVHKVVGGAAATGASLEAVAGLGRKVNESLVTMSASLDRTTVPGRADTDLHDDPTVAELGLGIHNEPGEKIKIPEVADLMDMLFEKLLADDSERHYVDFENSDEYLLLVNNIGGTSSLELLALTQYALERCPLSKKPRRVLVSDFVTSLNSPGFSLTLLNLTKASSEEYSVEKILDLVDKETDAPGWKVKPFSGDAWLSPQEDQDSPVAENEVPTSDIKVDGALVKRALKSAMEALIEKEPLITKYDTQVGDGDCGETLKAGADAVLDKLENDKDFEKQLSDPVAFLSVISDIVEEHMGGTSGGLYAIYTTSLVKNLQKMKSCDISEVADAMKAALYDGLFKYTKARKGGRTLVDTLQPFVDTLHETGDIKKLVDEAEKCCRETANLKAKFGRASYVNESEFTDGDEIPDPGAVGLLAIIKGFCGALE